MVRFHDLNIKRTEHVLDQKKTLKLAHKLGYEVVAVTDHLTDITKLCELPPAWKQIDLGPGTSELQQLSRITVVLNVASAITILNKPKIREYDIVAVEPASLETLQIAATNVKVDVISFSLTKSISFLMRYNHLKTAIDSGKFVEIYYSPLLTDFITRRECFTNAITLCQRVQAKGIIVTSMAKSAADLRGPYDVANLCLLFGLNDAQAKHAITSNCRALLMKSATRKTTVKSSLSIVNVKDIPKKDRWKIRNDGNGKRSATEDEEKEKGDVQEKAKKLRFS